MTDAEEKVIEMHVDVKVLISQVGDIKAWLDKHQESDTKHFNRLYNKISGMYKYATSVAIVAAGIGFIVGKI